MSQLKKAMIRLEKEWGKKRRKKKEASSRHAERRWKKIN